MTQTAIGWLFLRSLYKVVLHVVLILFPQALQERGIHIWDGNASRDYLDRQVLNFHMCDCVCVCVG